MGTVLILFHQKIFKSVINDYLALENEMFFLNSAKYDYNFLLLFSYFFVMFLSLFCVKSCNLLLNPVI